MIPVNEAGRRIGEAHPKARLTDEDVEIMRQMHERDGYGARRLSRAFKCGVKTAHQIIHYRVRNQWAVGFKSVTHEAKPGS